MLISLKKTEIWGEYGKIYIFVTFTILISNGFRDVELPTPLLPLRTLTNILL